MCRRRKRASRGVFRFRRRSVDRLRGRRPVTHAAGRRVYFGRLAFDVGPKQTRQPPPGLLELPLDFETLCERIRNRLAGPLPGSVAQLGMAPSTRARAEQLSVTGKSCREAAVLAILYPGSDGPSLVLTLRHANLPSHAGQISFPGGARDPGEELPETALREAHEEIGLAPELVQVLGQLTPLFVPPSGYCIYPFVGAVERLPALHPYEHEVSAVLHVPLSHLLSANTRITEEWVLRGEPVTVPFYRYETHKVWGATAMILAELLEVAR